MHLRLDAIDALHLADRTGSGGQLEQFGRVTRNLLVSWLGRPEHTESPFDQSST